MEVVAVAVGSGRILWARWSVVVAAGIIDCCRWRIHRVRAPVVVVVGAVVVADDAGDTARIWHLFAWSSQNLADQNRRLCHCVGS